MNAESKQHIAIIKSGSSWVRNLLRLAGWTLLTGLLAGCAMSKSSPSDSIVKQSPSTEKQTIARFEEGRTGFVITEIPEPGAPWISLFDKAVVLLQDGRDSAAIPILEEIVAEKPSVTAPYINLAMAYRHTERFEEAEQQLQAALALVPTHPVANNEYGLVLRQTGRFNEARRVYEATLETFPEYMPVRLNLGILCEIYLRDMTCALEQYSTYSEVNPGNEVVKLWIADLNLRFGGNR